MIRAQLQQLALQLSWRPISRASGPPARQPGARRAPPAATRAGTARCATRPAAAQRARASSAALPARLLQLARPRRPHAPAAGRSCTYRQLRRSPVPWFVGNTWRWQTSHAALQSLCSHRVQQSAQLCLPACKALAVASEAQAAAAETSCLAFPDARAGVSMLEGPPALTDVTLTPTLPYPIRK